MYHCIGAINDGLVNSAPSASPRRAAVAVLRNRLVCCCNWCLGQAGDDASGDGVWSLRGRGASAAGTAVVRKPRPVLRARAPLDHESKRSVPKADDCDPSDHDQCCRRMSL